MTSTESPAAGPLDAGPSILGYDPAPRRADVGAAYCDGADVAAAVMARYRATYALSPGVPPDCASGEPTDFSASPRFEIVFDDEDAQVWRLRE